ncbi:MULTISPECIES: phage portal protein [unclassified Cryobacterium]|uniref:phage portal protein n=1 Tax=unclassified Cryobacterium TaxID=2649013 RepID=UPI002AB3D684|nr:MULTISPECIES: phage portal protein [unclassified Cryobacterium]MDY7528459.1 phage portal protein [Cryobacterium sp. 10C2]MDY7555796.1 phage portal protein [Cryobacterium sp. 10C3]MEB0286167.1 phage portal protein [Cryobacterium sp. 10S3]MEB0289179.1 phage portal protein [Cryobacterium sp. 10C2]WPX12225.1 phage portal protein [Cryobacterium sp. 10S3]
MGLKEWLGFGEEKRALDIPEWFNDEQRARENAAGDNALRVIPVYAAVSLIADLLASLNVAVYASAGAGRKRVEPPAWFLRPDPRISRFDWLHQLAVSLLLRGNAYGIVHKNAFGISQVIWQHPDTVTVDEAGHWPQYWVGSFNTTLYEQGGQMLHIRAFVSPGSVKGLSPIGTFRARFETWMDAAGYGADWFKNSAVPASILQNKTGNLKPGQAEEVKAKWKASTTKREPVVLDQHWDWTKVSVTPEEAQFLQTIKATASQIATIFRVDPEDVGGETAGSLTYSTRESNQTRFNIRTLTPWTVRFKNGLDPLFPAGQSVTFDLDALARPNLLELRRANTEALHSGERTLAEIRAEGDREMLTEQEVADWQAWYATRRSASESTSESTSTSATTN